MQGRRGELTSARYIMGTLRVANEMARGQVVVTMIYNTGLKYLSTGLYP